MTRQTFFSAAPIALLFVLTVAGCGGGDKTEPSPTPAPTATPAPSPTPIKKVPGEVDFPLPDDLPRPPVVP